MRTLIVYFSRTGYTKRIAESIAKEMHATLLPITETRSRLGFIGYQRCVLEAAFGFDAKIDKAAIDPKSFDLVLLGTPIWGWHLASPVRAFARQHAQAIGSGGFFCTMSGSGASAAVTELQFQDMASQLIVHTSKILQGCAYRLASESMGGEDGDAVPFVEEVPERPNPVTQDEMDAGSIELF